MTWPLLLTIVVAVSSASGYIAASLPRWLDPAWRIQRQEDREAQQRLRDTLGRSSAYVERELAEGDPQP